MEIDKKIVDDTMSCHRNFGCLSNSNHVYCKVESCINQKVHFVEPVEKTLCNYKINFGESFICTCPTRKEIFKLYKQ